MSSTATTILPVTIAAATGSRIPSAVLDREGEFTIGRGEGNTITLEDPGVSRRHARLSLRGGSLAIRDLDSTHGVWVNGVRIDPGEDVMLHDRDLIGIASRSLLVRFANGDDDGAHVIPEPKPSATPRPPGDAAAPDAARSGTVATDGGAATVTAPASSDPFRTHPSIFLRLRADGTLDRQLGWEEFHRIYGPVIAGFARNAGLKPQEVEDIMQDVMLGFFRVVDHFVYDPRKGRFRGYLKRVTLNAIRSRRRRRRPQQNVPEELDPPAESSDLDVAWEREWTEHLLRRALDQVRASVQPRTMQAFELYAIKGMPADAVARETGMTEAAIRHAKMRILDQLRECIGRLRDEEG